jgi:hypothetical protein
MTQAHPQKENDKPGSAKDIPTKGPTVYYIPINDHGVKRWIRCDRDRQVIDVVDTDHLPAGLPLDPQLLPSLEAITPSDAGTAASKQLPAVPYVVSSGTLVPSALPVQAILEACSNAVEGAKDRRESKGGKIMYEHRTQAGSTWVEMRPGESDTEPDDMTIQALWQQVRNLSDLDADVFLAIMAQAVAGDADPKGFVWITAQHILNYRGIVPRIQRDEKTGKKRQAGHRQEDIAEVAACVERLSKMWLRVKQWILEPNLGKKKGAKRTAFSRACRPILVAETIYQHELGDDDDRETSVAVAWKVSPGTWIEPFLAAPNRHMAWIMQRTLQYDPYHEKWEKRLARYFTFHLRINASHGGKVLRRNIGSLVKELSLPINRTDPMKTKRRFTLAMDNLVKDGIISAWEHHHDNAILPPRQWLDHWMGWDILIHAAPSTNERYQNIASSTELREVKAVALRAAGKAKKEDLDSRK